MEKGLIVDIQGIRENRESSLSFENSDYFSYKKHLIEELTKLTKHIMVFKKLIMKNLCSLEDENRRLNKKIDEIENLILL